MEGMGLAQELAQGVGHTQILPLAPAWFMSVEGHSAVSGTHVPPLASFEDIVSESLRLLSWMEESLGHEGPTVFLLSTLMMGTP